MKKNISIIKRTLAVIFTGSLLAASLAGCGSGKEDKLAAVTKDTADNQTSGEEVTELEDYHYTGEKITIRLGDLAGCFSFAVAKEKGFLDEYFEGDNVEFEHVLIQGNGATVAQSLAADEVDFGVLGEQPAIAGIAGGYDIKIIGKNMSSKSFYPLYASEQSGVTSAGELKGKKVGVVYGTSLHYLTYKYLAGAGLSEDDVEIVQTTDINTLLLSGDIDAGVTTSMQGARLESEGAVYLSDESDYGIRQESTLCVRTEFAEQYPELTAKLLQAIDAADKWINENPAEAAEIAAEYGQFEVNVEQLYLQGNTVEVAYDETDIEILTDIIKFLGDNGMLADDSITLDDVLDLQYLERAGLR